MIAGSDFVQDLLAMIEIFKPVTELMLRMQSLDCPIWKLRQFWPKMEVRMTYMQSGSLDAYPLLVKSSIDDLYPGGVFKSVTLLEGWLVTNKKDDNAPGVDSIEPEQQFKWTVRQEPDIKRDREAMVDAMVESINSRLYDIMTNEVLATLEVFDAQAKSYFPMQRVMLRNLVPAKWHL